MWKSIDEFEGVYAVNEHGDVMNVLENRPIRTRLTHDGYVSCNLCHKNKSHIRLVHRLVAGAFVENPDNKPHVHHVDENKLNNDVSNLMWVTQQEHGKLRSKESKEKFRETYRRNLSKRKNRNI